MEESPFQCNIYSLLHKVASCLLKTGNPFDFLAIYIISLTLRALYMVVLCLVLFLDFFS